MPPTLTPNNPPESQGDELVRIDKAGSKARFNKFLRKIVKEKRWSEADLQEFALWLSEEDYSYKNTHWKEVWSSGAKVVGFDSEVRTPLAAGMPAGGIDLADIRREIGAGRLKKPNSAPQIAPTEVPKTSSSDIAKMVFPDDDEFKP